MESRTLEFREAVAQSTQRYPPSKQQLARFGAKRTTKVGGIESLIAEDAWTKQAEQVVSPSDSVRSFLAHQLAPKQATNLKSFTAFLASIRRAYLDLSSTSTAAHSKARTEIDPAKGLAAWEGVRWFTDRERDEVDFGVKIALKRSVDRVRELESAEQGQPHRFLRVSTQIDDVVFEFVARIARELAQLPSSSTLSRFLHIAPTASSVNTTLTSHRAHITLYLNTLLSKVSQIQINQQETRVKRQLEKSVSFGRAGGGDIIGGVMAEKARLGRVLDGKGKGKETEIGGVPDIYRPLPLPSSTPNPDGDEQSSIESLLTPAQIQQFETEASAALISTQSDLASLKQAEASLLEISALQSQLAIHLTQQSELTDKLWEEAVGVVGKVGEGNVELKKARERNRESRVWLLIFLLGASLSLLFLDYYS